ncbi:MAG: TetR/AcrR family transcriptional regulator [Phycicoccus sp.]
MPRWIPDAADRMRAVALAMFDDEGYGSVTARDIAVRVGVTERTFFRHFPTKADVLFGDASDIRRVLDDALDGAPSRLGPRDLVVAAGVAVAELVESDRDRETHRVRARVIRSEPELAQRELLKQQGWMTLLTAALEARGVAPARAAALAGATLAAFRAAYDGWVADRSRASLPLRFRRSIDDLATDLRPQG